MNWIFKCFRQYADFTGRSRRAEYWNFFTFQIIGSFILGIPYFKAVMDLSSSLGSDSSPSAVPFMAMAPLIIFGLAILVPSIAVTVRRLHDTGRSGWWYLLGLIPYAGIALYVLCAFDSEAGQNKWGPNPKTVA